MRVEVTRNGTPSVGVEGVQSDPASGRVGKFTGGKEGRELRKFGKETVHFTVNTKGLGGREEEYVSIIRWANRERRRAVSTFLKLPFVFHRFYEGFQVFKGFHGLFFKKGRGYPGAKVPEDLWGCNRENIFTGKPGDGVGAKAREPVFRVKIIIEKALLCGKKNRAFLIKFTSFVGEVLGDTPSLPTLYVGLPSLQAVPPPSLLPLKMNVSLDSQADHRLRTHTQAPIPPQIPPEEQTPMEDVMQNDPLQLSDSTRAALDQLLSQIDQATSTVETNLTADSYAALAALPLSYPWSCLVLDLKELLPILDR